MGKKIISKHIDKIFVKQLFAFLLIFFYPFNYQISNNILFGSFNQILLTSAGIVILALSKNEKVTKKDFRNIAITIALLVIIAVTNKYLLYNYQYGSLINLILYISILPILICKKIDRRAIIVALLIYGIEHTIGTLIPIIAPNYYKTNMLGFICEGKEYCFAKQQFLLGQNPGFTAHYSTNGIYIAITTLLLYAIYLKTKRKKYACALIAEMVLLLIIGKRAHLLFTIAAIVLVYLKAKPKGEIRAFFVKHVKLLIIAAISFLLLAIVTPHVPLLSTTISRLDVSKEQDVTTGRGELYELAVSEWQKSPIVGNGIGHYVYISNTHIDYSTYKTHYIRAHNDYLEILCDMGIIGLAIYLLIIITLIRSVFRAIKQKGADIITLFSALYIIFFSIYSVTGSPINTAPTLCLFIVITAIILKMKKETEYENN